MDYFTLEHIREPEEIAAKLQAVSAREVEASLLKPKLDDYDLLCLLSPAASPYLESMAERAQAVTRRRFGNVMKMYVPLYLSNECNNACPYCGFNKKHNLPRKTLTIEEVMQQAEILAAQGFQNLLLVSGESRAHVSVTYLAECISRLKDFFPEISIEVYPLETEEYALLREQGLYGLIVYQETYLPAAYRRFHSQGSKSNYTYRLQTPARGAAAGLRQVGLGVLLGLSDFRVDAFYLGLHARYLEKKYWQTVFGVSFPRLRQAEGNFVAPCSVGDKDLVQMVTALRLFLPDAPFSLSTREPEVLRRRLMRLGFTQMSAGSRTTPGGYGKAPDGLFQFQVEDIRSAKRVAEELAEYGLEPVWKDWDRSFGQE